MVLLFLLLGLSSCLDNPTENSNDNTDETSSTEDHSVDDVDDNTTILTYTSKIVFF